MNKDVVSLVISSLLLFGTANAFSKEKDTKMPVNFKIGEMKLDGNGCPKKLFNKSLESKKKEGKILLKFNEFSAEVAATKEKASVRKRCDLEIPLKIPKGYQVSLKSLNYFIDINLPVGASASFKREYSIDDGSNRNLNHSNSWDNMKQKNYKIKDRFRVLFSYWSKCGEDITITMENRLKINTYKTKALSSIKFPAMNVLDLKFRACKL